MSTMCSDELARTTGAISRWSGYRTPISPSPGAMPKRFGVPAVERVEDLLSEQPDVVVIAGIYGNHGRDVVAALRAGAHVLADKPLCISLEELDAIEAAAGRDEPHRQRHVRKARLSHDPGGSRGGRFRRAWRDRRRQPAPGRTSSTATSARTGFSSGRNMAAFSPICRCMISTQHCNSRQPIAAWCRAPFRAGCEGVEDFPRLWRRHSGDHRPRPSLPARSAG